MTTAPIAYKDNRGKVWRPHAIELVGPCGPIVVRVLATCREHARAQAEALKAAARARGAAHGGAST